MTQLEIEIREATDATKVVDVDFPKRQIEVVVMPYELEAEIRHGNRTFREIVSRGAFQRLDSKRRVNVNRDHVRERIVGRAIALHPSREEGLVAELEIAKTAAGTETLQLAREGLLSASAGFGVMDGGETWPERGLRRLNKIWLDHIAMTPEPAYEGTDPIAVRDLNYAILEPAAATPYLDEVRGWDLADRYALIDLTT